MATEIHVRTSGSDTATGSAAEPLRTISRAAALAMPGDVVTVHEGVYREWVRPPRGGRSDHRRITYRAAEGEHVLVTGAEQVTGWELDGDPQGSVWTVTVPNTLFGDWNPFALEVAGDWVVYAGADAPRRHLGDVYLDGRSSYEVSSRQEVDDPPRRTEVLDDWTGVLVDVLDPDQTQQVWYAEVGESTTQVWANFQGSDPGTHLVEVNVRRSVFSPVVHHVDYITVRGFELAQAATPWAPPTADQPGLVGPTWAKGWVIEDNVIHDAKCSAVSLGKEASTGHNFAALRGDKPGYQYQLESVFAARQIGWDAEHVGSHVVRRNRIYDCGQNAVVGHLGCVFATIEDNEIYRIAVKREFYGYEIAGIKLHAAIDVVLAHNHVHDCSLGIWLDWQAQGTRVTRNVLHDNSRDLFVEVSHGPYLVDSNVLGSRASLELFSQGGAFVGNLVRGTVATEPVVERPTPYHLPHSTQVAGYAAILGGDDRYRGNVFWAGEADRAYGPDRHPRFEVGYGTGAYDGHPGSFEAYLEAVGDPSHGDHERFADVKQPVYVSGNVYGPGAAGYEGEAGAVRLPDGASFEVVVAGDEVYLEADLPPVFDEAASALVTGDDLPPVRLAGAGFEERDGTPVRVDRDVVGTVKEEGRTYAAGPVAGLTSGRTRTRVW